MRFLDKRIGVICNELEKVRVTQKSPVQNWAYREGFFLHPEDLSSGDLRPFGADMRWSGNDAYYWFRNTVAVPEDFAGQPLWLSVCTQVNGWDARNPQFLAFVNGEAAQGLDTNHRDILLSESAQAGEIFQIDLQAYTGTEHSELQLVTELKSLHPDIHALYYDLLIPLQAFARLDDQPRAKAALEETLNNAINLLDLRQPHSAECVASVRQAREYLQTALYTDLAGRDDVIATCIGHTHIDVAWWWTVEQTRQKAARSFATVLKLMDEFPSYRFMSSQPQLYQFVKERYPRLYQRIRQRVAQKRWEPEGGMWVEADCNLTSGESLVRQFLYGKAFFREEFGVDNRILWLPDVFGYSGALPQIMKKCGIDYFMTTKLSWNQINRHPYDTFLWRGIDGSEVLTHLITTPGVGQKESEFFTTYNGMLHPDAIIGAWRRYQQKALNHDVLVSYGYGDGGGGPTREMLETSTRMETGIQGTPKVRQAFARTYFDELGARLDKHPRLPVWEGELYFEYHRGTYTSMARNKRSNRKAEFHLADLELLGLLAPLPYPADTLDSLWKLTLTNQFHDILPGSSIREVYDVTREEYAHLEAVVSGELVKRMDALTDASEAVTVFNTTGFMRDDIVSLPQSGHSALRDEDGRLYPLQHCGDQTVAFLRGIPSKGYRSFALADDAPCPVPFTVTGERGLQTPYYTVQIDENGCISSLWDKENRREVFKAPGNVFRMYEDKPIYYDNWDIDMYYTEKYWDALSFTRCEWTDIGPVRATLAVERTISQSVIWQNIHFYADTRRIDFETTVDWHEHQHLLKVHFPLDIHTDEATFDIQFGNLKRKTHRNTSWDEARFESCGQKWVDLSEGHYGVSLLNDCKYGHSVKDSDIGLTLIKSGIEPNPDTDNETHTFLYSLFPHAGGWQDSGTVRESYFINQPAYVAQGAAETFGMASSSHPNVVLETIKRAQNGDGVIVRLFECDNALTSAALHWALPIQSVTECNLIEEPLGDVPFEQGRIAFTIRPYEIKTYRIR